MVTYKNDLKGLLEIHHQKCRHVSPHVHSEIEFILVTEGTLEFGIEKELYHMEKGDFAIAFSGLAHHYQVFGDGPHRAFCLKVCTELTGAFQITLKQDKPVNPVIPRKLVHPDVLFAMNSIYTAYNNLRKGLSSPYTSDLFQAYTLLILSRTMGRLELEERKYNPQTAVAYSLISYIAAHYQEELTLESVAHDLACSPYELSRIFSGTLHTNFNTYLNERRLEYAVNEMINTDLSITDIYENAGFQSQRTFNRAFKERYRMSPREFRKQETE